MLVFQANPNFVPKVVKNAEYKLIARLKYILYDFVIKLGLNVHCSVKKCFIRLLEIKNVGNNTF